MSESTVHSKEVSSQVNETELMKFTKSMGTRMYWSKFTEILGHYQTKATMHGVSQTLGPHAYPCRSVVWILFILIMALCLVVTLFLEVSSLTQYPIKTATRATLKDRLHFPAVTVCNLNQYHKDRVNDSSFRDVIYYNSEFQVWDPRIDPTHIQTNVSGQELLNMARYAAPSLKELLIDCFWMYEWNYCSKFFSEIYTSSGTCYTFNNNRSALRMVSGTSPMAGLRLILNTDSSNYYYSKTLEAGIKVIIHEPEETPFPEHGLSVRPGVSASIALSRHESTSLPRPYKAFENHYCEDTSSESYKNPLKRFSKYSATACIEECIVDRIVQKCNCRFYNDPGNDTICSAEELFNCYFIVYGNITQDYVESCECPPECKSVIYQPVFSYADSSSEFMDMILHNRFFLGNHPLPLDFFRNNIIDVQIFFQTLTVDEVYQEPEKNTLTILANLGGQMGIFLGVSIISVTELGEMFVLLLVRYIRARRDARRDEHDQRSDQQNDDTAGTFMQETNSTSTLFHGDATTV